MESKTKVVYENLTLPQLRDELRKRKAKISGRKKELIERLQFYDQNATASISQMPEFRMDLPSCEDYKDAHAGMSDQFPKVSSKQLDEYLSSCRKVWDEKCKEMYEQRYIRFFRVALKNSLTYASSTVWAEMKKSVAYTVDVSFDDNGVIQEAECECGAGQGPTAHCKHVCLIIFAAIQFKEKGSIISELTCTQQLQTFHHAKVHKGSAVKACGLMQIQKDDREICYDSRPRCFHDDSAYPDFFRSSCLNHTRGASTTVRHLTAPANFHAVCHDHDYLLLSPEDTFLEREEITTIKPDRINQIEEQTRLQSRCHNWAEERAKRITASHFGAVCKATMRQDRHKLALSILNPAFLHGAAVQHGQKYESVAVEQFETLHNIKSRSCGLYICAQYPYLAASPDGLLDDDTIIEVKCPYTAHDAVITPESVPYLEWDENGKLTLNSNHAYMYQIQGQMLCTGKKVCTLTVYTKKDMKAITIDYSATFVDAMVLKLKDFFTNYFKPALVDDMLYRHYYDSLF